MKKLIILSLFIANYSFAQSVTIVPTNTQNTEFLKIQKTGIGLDHRRVDGTVGVGTYVDISGGYIQTHTNHPLLFSTNNGTAKMTLATNGNFGIGEPAPSHKLHVQGNGYFTGNLDSDGLLSGATLNIGGGTTISKYFETLLTNQQISSVPANVCGVNTFTVTGVGLGDTIILNMESAFSTLAVGNVRASGTNQIEIKFCNIGNVATGIVASDMRVTVIK